MLERQRGENLQQRAQPPMPPWFQLHRTTCHPVQMSRAILASPEQTKTLFRTVPTVIMQSRSNLFLFAAHCEVAQPLFCTSGQTGSAFLIHLFIFSSWTCLSWKGHWSSDEPSPQLSVAVWRLMVFDLLKKTINHKNYSRIIGERKYRVAVVNWVLFVKVLFTVFKCI